jgi:hypothetical protein
MQSLYHAYEAYERRVMRGEMNLPAPAKPSLNPPLRARLGDWLIRAGTKLKTRSASGTSMAWSPLTRSKP